MTMNRNADVETLAGADGIGPDEVVERDDALGEPHHGDEQIRGAVAGAVVGAVVGTLAGGPVGTVVGGALGAAAGATAGLADEGRKDQEARATRDVPHEGSVEDLHATDDDAIRVVRPRTF